MLWALRSAPVLDPIKKLVLIALADSANDDGTGAFPGVSTIAEYANCDPRTVRRQLAALEAEGLISRGDQAAAARYISRADRRPVVWDLNLERKREVGAPTHRKQPSKRPKAPRNQHTVTDEPGDLSPQAAEDEPTGGHSVLRSDDDGRTYGRTYGRTSDVLGSIDPKEDPDDDDDALPRDDPPVPIRDELAEFPTVMMLADILHTAIGRHVPFNLSRQECLELSGAIQRVGDLEPFLEAAVAQDAHNVRAGRTPGGTARAYVKVWLCLRGRRMGSVQQSRAVPWCGVCDKRTRLIEDEAGVPRRCHVCHPSQQAVAAI